MNSFEEFLSKFILAIFLAVSSAGICPILISAAEVNGTAGQSKEITGRIVDSNGEPIAGAAVMIQGTSNGLLADNDGKFQITASEGQVIIVSMMGFSDKNVRITGKSDYLIIMEEVENNLDEVTVVAFSTQKKESMVSAVSTIRPAELKTPTSNLTTALGGRISGMITQQISGEPGSDNAQFFIRGVTTFNSNARGPLILIDNVELSSNDLARLQPDDIASFSILKDATATALYGARGANGVILVTTKEGREGKTSFNVRFENSFSMPTRDIELVDPITFMELRNEAITTRDPLSPRFYSDKKIASTRHGVNPYAYPAINWRDEMFKNYTTNQRVNANLTGGGRVARYYVAATFNNDTGLLKDNPDNKFSNNIRFQTIQLRSNVNINVTRTTEMAVRFSGTFEDYRGPLNSGSDLYRMALASDPVLFPMYYPSENTNMSDMNHVLFGNYGDGSYLNPYARMVRGYKESNKMNLIAQVEFKQKLDFITKGLNARALINTTRYSYYDVSRYFDPFYYSMQSYDQVKDMIRLTAINPESGTEYLNYNEGGKDVSTATYFESAIDYNRNFKDKHDVSGLLVFTMQNRQYANQGSLQKSLAYRNMGLAGRFTYGYDGRYLLEANFGYNGSERFAAGNRWGFFPSLGVGYVISNESFYGEKLKNVMNLLKLKATYGLAGNDQIGDGNDRFFYLSQVNMARDMRHSYGENLDWYSYGIGISRYSNDKITWELAKKLDVGIELGLWNNTVSIQADYFREKRYNILMDRSSVPSTLGLQAGIRSNVGEASSHGFEISIDANKSFAGGYWISGRFNMTYAAGQYDVYEEPDYGYPWMSHEGRALNQWTGLIAERLFIDESDVANSPYQTCGPDAMPGDIKYKDINGDDIIDMLDMVPIGNPTIPSYIYGFGFSAGIKGFDISCFFQAAAETSFMIDKKATAPFLNLGVADATSTNGMLKVWADDHWSESNPNIYAQWPRLSNKYEFNNDQASTWWLRDGSYLRCKSVEIGYTFPEKWMKKARIDSFRLYVSGTNLFTISNFKLWDVEMGGNGLNYPIQRVFNLGLNLNF